MLGKDQVEFSKFVGISVSALRRIEQESGNVTLSTVMKILNKFSMVLTVKVKS
jgi:transcriptional regulator with XRE-family HTH domain